MAEIKRKQLDELENLTLELCFITYLQALVDYDKNCGDCIITEFEFLKGANAYLLEKQTDAVLKLNNLFNSM